MKIRPLNVKQAEAITNLHRNDDFAVFMDYVGNYGEDLVKALLQNPTLDNPEYHRGSAGAMTEVMEAVGKAPEVLEKFINQEK